MNIYTDKSDEKFLETLEINRKLDEIVDNLRCSLPIHGLADSETYTLPDHPDVSIQQSLRNILYIITCIF